MSSTDDTKPCGCNCPCNCPNPNPEPTPTPTPNPEPKPTEDKGRVKDWGSVDTNPNNWKVVSMKDDKTKFKVVDKSNVNVADNFNTKEGAQKFIDDAIANYKPEPKPEPNPTPTPTPTTGNVDSFGVLKIYPDADSKRFLTNGEIEAKIRHYASGKPDDNTIEFNIDTKDKKFRDMEATIVIKNKGMQHHDRFSYKLRGGAHKDGQGQWYIFETSTDGKWTNESFQVERPHPSYHKFGDKIKPLIASLPSDLRSATIGIKAITINRTVNGKEGVHLEQWINLDPLTADGKPKNEGWQKYMEVDDVGQFDEIILECQGTNVTMRIDGILSIKDKQKMPEFLFGSVREIKNQ